MAFGRHGAWTGFTTWIYTPWKENHTPLLEGGTVYIMGAYEYYGCWHPGARQALYILHAEKRERESFATICPSS